MEIVFTLLVGVVVGLIDALPMFLKKMNRANCWSAFLQYVVVTVVVFNTTLPQFGVNDWLVGPIVSFLMALPMVVMIGKRGKENRSFRVGECGGAGLRYFGYQAFRGAAFCLTPGAYFSSIR